MFFIVISMVVIVAVAGLVVAFVALPHRGEELPGAPWLGESTDRAGGVLPTLDDQPEVLAETGPHGAVDEEPDARR